MRWRDGVDGVAIALALMIGALALQFNDTSYIVILSPLALVGAVLMLTALALNRRWWLLLCIPFFAIPFVPWHAI